MRGQRQHLEVARSARCEAVARRRRVDRGQEADLAEVDGEHRDAGARVVAQRRAGSCRRRRARGRGRRRSLSGVVDLTPRRLDAVLARLLGVEAQRRRRLARAAAEPSRAPRAISSGRRWVMTVATRSAHGSTSARRRARGPSTRAVATGLGKPDERLLVALRPGQARRREAEHRRAERRAPLGDAHQRGPAPAGSRTTPPLPTCSRPTSNCGLTIARQSKRSAPRRPAPRAAPWPAR